ncbi:peroxisomal biogenesis factor 11 [Xylariaceae sp. FL0662B]|nr:peroxisomal biogenesis factor 11 [Xylariaceae sp. FL0662B]
MSRTFEQFVRFSTDSVGLERTFRLFQSLAQILSSFSLPFSLLLYLLSTSQTTSPPPSPAVLHGILGALRQRLALARRYLRLFRFLESFGAAQKLYASLSSSSHSSSPSAWADWLDVGARSFNGMYLLLEASTIVDALQVDGLAVWGPEWEPRVGVEAQRFWLFALVCAAGAGLLRIRDVLASAPAPAPAAGPQRVEKEKGKGKGKGKADEGGARGDLKRERAGADRQRSEVRAKVYKLGRGVIANVLDITLPGSVVGWVKADSGTVGLAMFVTTILTSMDVWERCGREVAGG